MSKLEKYSIIVIVCGFVLGIMVYPMLPQLIASHWNIYDTPDRFIPKGIGIFAIPVASLLMFYVFRYLPQLDPYQETKHLTRKYYEEFLLVLMSYLFYIHFVMLIWNTGLRFQVAQALTPGLGILIYYLGDLVHKTKHRSHAGFGAIWITKNTNLWNKVHSFSGSILKAAGIITMVGLLFPSRAIYFLFAPTLMATVYILGYSWHEINKTPVKKKRKKIRK